MRWRDPFGGSEFEVDHGNAIAVGINQQVSQIHVQVRDSLVVHALDCGQDSFKDVPKIRAVLNEVLGNARPVEPGTGDGICSAPKWFRRKPQRVQFRIGIPFQIQAFLSGKRVSSVISDHQVWFLSVGTVDSYNGDTFCFVQRVVDLVIAFRR